MNTTDKHEKPPTTKDLPAKSPQRGGLLHVPRQSLQGAIEQSATIYFGFARRLAAFFNRKH